MESRCALPLVGRSTENFFRAGLVVTSSVLNELGNDLVVDLRSGPPEDVASHLPCIMGILLQFAIEVKPGDGQTR